MGRLISEMNDRQKEKTDHLYLQRNQLRKALINCPKSKTHNRQTIGKKLQLVREEIRSLPIVTTGYQLIFKTSDTFWHFMGWAVGAGWNAAKRPSSRWLEEFDRRRALEKQNKAIENMQWTDLEWTNALKDYRQYENVAIEEFPLTDWEQYKTALHAN